MRRSSAPADSESSSHWGNRNFVLLWCGQSVSYLGTTTTYLALPLVAVLVMDATPLQMGLLTALAGLPAVLLGLVAGVWVDRLPRRAVMAGSDVGRFLLLVSVPATAATGLLTFAQLGVVAFSVAALGLCFDVAHQSLVPEIVSRPRLAAANGAFAASRAASEAVGPGLAGGLVRLLGPAGALLADATSYLVSAGAILGMRGPLPSTATSQRGLAAAEMRIGLQFLWQRPVLRAIALSALVTTFFATFQESLLMLFYIDRIGMPVPILGAVLSAAGIVAVVGALNAGRLIRCVGAGRAVMAGQLTQCLGAVAIASATRPLALAAFLIFLGESLISLGVAIFGTTALTIRQDVTPAHLRGRVNGAARFLSWSLLPVGPLAGGAAGQAFGLRAALLAGGIGTLGGFVLLLDDRVRRAPGHRNDGEMSAREPGGSRAESL